MVKDNSLKEKRSEEITRKDALKKMGSYAAVAALGSVMLLNPQKSQAQSPPPNPGPDGSGFQNTSESSSQKNNSIFKK
jgi:hypothetical protein